MATEYVAAIVTTLVLTTAFAWILVRTDIETIRANWDTRRCEVPVQLLAAALKPNDDPRSGMDFAKDNFSFCASNLASNVIRAGFAPFQAILGKQLASQEVMAGPMIWIRGMLQTARNTFANFMNDLFDRYKRTMIATTQGWHHIYFAMGRIQAIVLGLVYAGLSLSATIENTINFIIKVVLIFIGILAALIILLWFVLLPVIPTIVVVIAVIMAAGFGAAASHAGAFCVDPAAIVRMADGTERPLSEIRVGDCLATYKRDETPNTVEGVLTVDATDEPIVSIYGIKMSGSHRVLYKKRWILAREHPEAISVIEKMQRLICLNTTHHTVPIALTNTIQTLFVGDWEEVSTEEGQRAWIDLVNIKLNGPNTVPITNYPKSVPLVGKTVSVIHETKGLLPIESVQIGDSILDKDDTFTIVKGIYKGQAPYETTETDWISDGVWKSVNGRFWILAGGQTKCSDSSEKTAEGLFLVTESETFVIQRDEKQFLVRDFTEVGASQIDSTYEMLDFFIHKKSQT
jgi:hypothetical protein